MAEDYWKRQQLSSRQTQEAQRYDEIKQKVAKDTSISKLLDCYKQLQLIFQKEHAKSWNDIPKHAVIRTNAKTGLATSQGNRDSLSFDPTTIQFKLTDYTYIPEDQRGAYLELYEMVYAGDVQGIKKRTLSRWGPDDSKAPLKVSISDSITGSTLIMVALSRKQHKLAKMLLDIANAQYDPSKNKTQFYVDRDDYSDDGSESDPEYYISSEKIDDSFELGDVTHIPEEAHIDIKPIDLLRRPGKIRPLADAQMDKKLSDTNLASTGNAATLALIENDFESYVKILDLADEYDPGNLLSYTKDDNRWSGANPHAYFGLRLRSAIGDEYGSQDCNGLGSSRIFGRDH